MFKMFTRCFLLSFLIPLSGCISASKNVTNTQRSGIEQLLISTCVDRAVSELRFNFPANNKVYLDARYLDAVDKSYLIAALRDHLGQSGANLVELAEEANLIVEIRSGAVATDEASLIIGLPSIDIPSFGVGSGTVKTPEVALYKKTHQRGTSKLALNVLQASDGKHLKRSGNVSGKAFYNRWIVLFVPFNTTDIPELEKVEETELKTVEKPEK